MAISYINTVKVENIAKDILSLANDLNIEINNLFNRFSEVPTVTREWVGQQAQTYFRIVASEKKQYTNFVNDIRDIGHKLSTDVYEIQTCINKNINGETKKGN